MAEQPSIVCPMCGRRSYHPKDIEYRYCPVCGYHDSIQCFVRITAPHFCAGIHVGTNEAAPILRYMSGWTFQQIKGYCRKKGWTFEIVWLGCQSS